MYLNEYPVSVYGDIGGQSRQAAETYNRENGGERYRIVVVVDGSRFVGEHTYDRVTLAMERVIEIERAAGVKAFAVAEKFVALR
jgi:hypothetical protein